MRTSGPPSGLKLRRAVEEQIVWPLLDLRDWMLRRSHHDKPLYPVHHVPLRVRLKWAVLDAFDGAAQPVKTHRRHHEHSHRTRRRIGVARAVQLAAVPVALMAVLAVVLIGGGGSSGSSPAAATVPPPGPPAQIQVAGVSDSAAERRARRERRAARRERAAGHRRALRRKHAAARRRAAARRKHARKKHARAKASAPASPAAGTPPAATQTPPAATTPISPPASSAPGAPSGGGGASGGGGGTKSPPKKQPQPSPGVQFDDTG